MRSLLVKISLRRVKSIIDPTTVVRNTRNVAVKPSHRNTSPRVPVFAGRVRIGRRDLLGFRHVALNPYRHRVKAPTSVPSPGKAHRRLIQKGERPPAARLPLGRRITFLVWGEGFQWTGGGRNE